MGSASAAAALNIGASEALLRVLLVLYAGACLMSALLSLALWLRYRAPLQRSLVLVWLTTLVGTLAHGVLPPLARGPLAMVIPFWSAFAMSLAMADLLTRLVSARPRWRAYGAAFAAGAAASIVAVAGGLPFWLVALPSAVGVSLPVLHAALVALFRPGLPTTPICKATAVSCLLSGLHNLDYPFLRNRPELALAGFTLALIVVFAMSITAPAVILERVAEERARIAQVDRMKSQFFANISHELRTPLTLILAPADQLLLGSQTVSERALIETIQRNALRLERHIDDLLDLSRLDAGGLRLSVAPVDLGHVASTVWKSALPLAEERGIDLSLDALCSTPDVHGDAHRLDSILTNLLANALKYVSNGNHIVIRVRDAADCATVAVADDGPGIAVEDQARIFDRFFRAAAHERRRTQGAGIGLALAKELAELHGGALTVESTPGKGATFTLRLPKGRAHFRPEVLERRRGAAPGSTPRRRFDDVLSEHASTDHVSLPAPENGKLQRARILVVEDMSEMRAFLKSLLDTEFDVIEARDGDEGLRMATSQRPDLVLTDVMMPGGRSGVELCQAIKSDPALLSTPVILLTAAGGAEATLGAFARGADDFVTKPFHPQVLLARVRAHLRLRELSIQLMQREKVLALGTLAAGMVHEIRNPLNAILNGARALQDGRATAEGAHTLLRVVQDGARRIDGIVGALDEHVRPAERGERGVCDVRRGIESTLAVLAHRMQGVKVRRDYRARRPALMPAASLNQVLVNLMDNALRAGARTLRVGTADSGGHVVVTIADDGGGIAEEIAARVFDPFFTTREVGAGTGLGLYLCRQILRRHGGDVSLAHVGAPGAVFQILVPAGAGIEEQTCTK